MQTVLLSGKQGSGKSTIQKLLIETCYKRMHWHCIPINFADTLYEMHNAVLGILHRYWPDRGLVKDGPLLQVLGTDWGRNTIDKNIWVEIMKNRLKIYEPSYQLAIIGDSRFENEFDDFPDALRVRLTCPEALRRQRCSMWRENTEHPSEIALDAYERRSLFDLTLHTDQVDAEGCVELIMAQLNKNVWKEKRGAKV